MAIFKRMKSIALSDIHRMLDKMEDPLSMMDQYLREMEEEIRKAEEALAQQLYVERRFERMIQQTEETIRKRTRQMNLAVERNEDDIAKLAIREKMIYEKRLKEYKEQKESIHQQTKTLSEAIKSLIEKYEELKQKKLVLLSRATVAQTTAQIQHAVVSFNPENIVKGFSRIEEQIMKMEAKAKASQTLFEKHQELEQDPLLQQDIEKELEKLKQERSQTA
ncbi:PspA/IM30 family protein [Peribacillus tepidiphilus]|uniref:PspA/IM30 family protein n=1 Tax=Peribacillus tepidiphilus TaxID=2652445 RepID=UPI0012924ED2|nr:PspA/IM30 family protein [Peribacillus tepidiphilus]